MSNISQSAASVVKGTGATLYSPIPYAAEAITAGMPFYVKVSDGLVYKSQSDGTAEEAGVHGIALNSAGIGQPVVGQNGGSINLGGTLVAATTYGVSDTAGAICPVADFGSGKRCTIIGVATSTSLLTIAVNNTGILIS